LGYNIDEKMKAFWAFFISFLGHILTNVLLTIKGKKYGKN